MLLTGMERKMTCVNKCRFVDNLTNEIKTIFKSRYVKYSVKIETDFISKIHMSNFFQGLVLLPIVVGIPLPNAIFYLFLLRHGMLNRDEGQLVEIFFSCFDALVPMCTTDFHSFCFLTYSTQTY